MLAFIRLALQLLVFFLLVSVVIGIGSPDTGPAEKAVLAAVAGLLIWLASHVRRIGASSLTTSS